MKQARCKTTLWVIGQLLMFFTRWVRSGSWSTLYPEDKRLTVFPDSDDPKIPTGGADDFGLQFVEVNFNSSFVLPYSLYLGNLRLLSDAQVFLIFSKGIVVSRETSPFIRYGRSGIISKTVFSKSRIAFYNRYLAPINTSCDSFLASYFDLELDDIKHGRINKTHLFESIESGPFSNIDNLEFGTDIEFDGPFCPLLFKNSVSEQLTIQGLQSNRLVRSMLEFWDLSHVSGGQGQLNLNATNRVLLITHIYRVGIGSATLNKDVFKLTKNLVLSGVLAAFPDEDVFKNLRALRKLILEATNLREFLHSSTNKWIEYLNYEVDTDPNEIFSEISTAASVALSQSLLLMLSDLNSHTPYSFPDEDFCLFRHYNPRKLVMIKKIHRFKFENLTTLSCLLIYVCYFGEAVGFDDIPDGSVDSFPYFSKQEFNACKIEDRLKACFQDSLPDHYSGPLNRYDLFYSFA